MTININGARVIERRESVIFIRLPRELWRLCEPDGKCSCPTCTETGRAAYWDTLAVPTEKRAVGADTVYTVHHPDPRDHVPFTVYELDGTKSTMVCERPEGPGYWSVLIPYVSVNGHPPTQWHPTEPNGPFETLSRGAFDTEGKAVAWALEHLHGHPYRLAFYCMPDAASDGNAATNAIVSARNENAPQGFRFEPPRE